MYSRESNIVKAPVAKCNNLNSSGNIIYVSRSISLDIFMCDPYEHSINVLCSFRLVNGVFPHHQQAKCCELYTLAHQKCILYVFECHTKYIQMDGGLTVIFLLLCFSLSFPLSISLSLSSSPAQSHSHVLSV